jgi:hypothetical protein
MGDPKVFSGTITVVQNVICGAVFNPRSKLLEALHYRHVEKVIGNHDCPECATERYRRNDEKARDSSNPLPHSGISRQKLRPFYDWISNGTSAPTGLISRRLLCALRHNRLRKKFGRLMIGFRACWEVSQAQDRCPVWTSSRRCTLWHTQCRELI